MDELLHLRQSIDVVDKKILSLIGRRLRLVRRMGRVKKKQGLPIRDPKREAEILRAKVATGRRSGIPAKFVKNVWRLFFEEAYRHEQ